jgi:protein-S-isoprenylcysteine O-methyltransferase Ste14
LIIFFGISTSLSNWLSVLLMMISVTMGYLYRIQVEETFMMNELGDCYLSYHTRTKRIIPLIY